jgi:sulfur-carrier protein adenylyltransferase/sulfurtransferase
MDEGKIIPIWPEELKIYLTRHQEKDFLLVDVRQPQEYEKEHLPGAQLIPLGIIMEGRSSLPRDKALIFYCSHGMRSRAASEVCAGTGEFTKPLYSLMGGISAWEEGVVSDFPKMAVFEGAHSEADWAKVSMNLEKGAFLFYDYLIKKCAETSFVKELEDISAMETVHARLIYNLFPRNEGSTEMFQDVFGALPGDIVEGGQSLEKVCRVLERMPGAFLANALDMALRIEYAAYDLYRSLANESGKNPQIQKALLTLSQAEKKHAYQVTRLFENVF